MYSPTFATSQGSRIVSPATNLKVSEREIKLGSGLFMCVVTVKNNKKKIAINKKYPAVVITSILKFLEMDAS